VIRITTKIEWLASEESNPSKNHSGLRICRHLQLSAKYALCLAVRIRYDVAPCVANEIILCTGSVRSVGVNIWTRPLRRVRHIWVKNFEIFCFSKSIMFYVKRRTNQKLIGFQDADAQSLSHFGPPASFVFALPPPEQASSRPAEWCA